MRTVEMRRSTAAARIALVPVSRAGPLVGNAAQKELQEESS